MEHASCTADASLFWSPLWPYAAFHLSAGIIFGSIAGYFGGKADTAITRVMDVLMAVPALAVRRRSFRRAGLRPHEYGAGHRHSRNSRRGADLMRSTVMSVKSNEFVEAAKATGSRNARIIFKHILPNTIAPLIVSSTLGIGGCIMAISGLSFLGLGVAAAHPGVGLDPRRRPDLHPRLLADHRIPVAFHHADAVRVQSFRGRPPGRS